MTLSQIQLLFFLLLDNPAFFLWEPSLSATPLCQRSDLIEMNEGMGVMVLVVVGGVFTLYGQSEHSLINGKVQLRQT